MKTYLVYGFAFTFAATLLTLVLYFLGYHSDATKIESAMRIANVVTLAAAIGCLVLGTKARRAELPPTEDFGYGRAFSAGIMITLFAALLSIVTNYLYMSVINPDFGDTIIQAKITQMEAKGIPGGQIEGAEKMMHKFMSPPVMAVLSFLGVMFWGTILSLITAAFLKRPATQSPTSVTV